MFAKNSKQQGREIERFLNFVCQYQNRAPTQLRTLCETCTDWRRQDGRHTRIIIHDIQHTWARCWTRLVIRCLFPDNRRKKHLETDRSDCDYDYIFQLSVFYTTFLSLFEYFWPSISQNLPVQTLKCTLVVAAPRHSLAACRRSKPACVLCVQSRSESSLEQQKMPPRDWAAKITDDYDRVWQAQ